MVDYIRANREFVQQDAREVSNEASSAQKGVLKASFVTVFPAIDETLFSATKKDVRLSRFHGEGSVSWIERQELPKDMTHPVIDRGDNLNVV